MGEKRLSFLEGWLVFAWQPTACYTRRDLTSADPMDRVRMPGGEATGKDEVRLSAVGVRL